MNEILLDSSGDGCVVIERFKWLVNIDYRPFFDFSSRFVNRYTGRQAMIFEETSGEEIWLRHPNPRAQPNSIVLRSTGDIVSGDGRNFSPKHERKILKADSDGFMEFIQRVPRATTFQKWKANQGPLVVPVGAWLMLLATLGYTILNPVCQ